MNVRIRCAASVFSAVLAVIVCWLSCQTTFPWCDELVLADKSANWAVCGSYLGYVWPQTYNFMYPFTLALAFKTLGVGHATVCIVTVSCAFLASLALLSIGRRRGFLVNEGSRLLFVALFWCAGSMMTIYANGRLDTMTMLFTVLLADALWPDSVRKDRKSLVQTAIWSFMLMLTSVYMLPLMFVFGLLALCLCGHDARPALVRRGFACALAFCIAYAVMFGIYAYEREMIRFAGFYLYFNTITGHCPIGLGERILRAYSGDLWAPTLVILALVLGMFRRNRTAPIATAFVAAVPLLMTALGRYEPYYAWAFCVPAALLFAAMLPRRTPVLLTLTLAFAILCHSGHTRTRSFMASRTARADKEMAETFVREHSPLWGTDVDIVVAEDVGGDSRFFYPLIKTGSRLWYRGAQTLSDPSDSEKFRVGLSGLIKDPERREEILKRVMAYQRCMPTLPASALFVFPSRQSYEDVPPLLRERGYAFTASVVEWKDIRVERWTRTAGVLW